MIVNVGCARFAISKASRDRIEHYPIVGNVAGVTRIATGVFRTLFGISVGSAEYAWTSDPEHHLAHIRGGVTDVGRGMVAIVPVLGQLLLWAYDEECKRQAHFDWDLDYRLESEKINGRKRF